MSGNSRITPSPHRVWLVRYADWQPADQHDVPTQGQIEKPALESLLSLDDALAFAAGFNAEMLRDPQGYWAVVLPAIIAPPNLALAPPITAQASSQVGLAPPHFGLASPKLDKATAPQDEKPPG